MRGERVQQRRRRDNAVANARLRHTPVEQRIAMKAIARVGSQMSRRATTPATRWLRQCSLSHHQPDQQQLSSQFDAAGRAVILGGALLGELGGQSGRGWPAVRDVVTLSRGISPNAMGDN